MNERQNKTVSRDQIISLLKNRLPEATDEWCNQFQTEDLKDVLMKTMSLQELSFMLMKKSEKTYETKLIVGGLVWFHNYPATARDDKKHLAEHIDEALALVA